MSDSGPILINNARICHHLNIGELLPNVLRVDVICEEEN